MRNFLGSICLLASFFLVLFFVTGDANGQWLEVNLTSPDTSLTTNVIQNKTFFVNATMYCRDPLQVTGCGNVNSTIRYNASGEQPDTPISEVVGDTPFFVNGSGFNSKMCPSNPLSDGEFCNVTWHINATDDIGSFRRIGAVFNTSLFVLISPNHTDNSTVSILDCTVDYTLHWSSISFGNLSPNTENNSAPGNSDGLYNLTLNDGSCPTDFYIRGDDLRNNTYDANISVINVSWSNISSDIDQGFFKMNYTHNLFFFEAVAPRNITTWYWINTPAVFAGIYNSTVYITGVISRSAAPP